VLLRSSVRRDDWRRWLLAAGASFADQRHVVDVMNSSEAYAAAIDGVGIAMIQQEHAQDDLASGRLVSPWPFALRTGELYYIAARKLVPDHVATFRNWMVASTH
jgi:LysR family glycine cleavage system transcriptional activator